jgi:hypothetical protein
MSPNFTVPVDNGIALPLTAGRVLDRQLTVSIHDDEVAVLILHGGHVDELDPTCVPCLDVRLLDPLRGRSSDVERAHRELGSRLPDRLSRDHAHGLSEVDESSLSKIAPVAEHAYAAPNVAREHRADRHALDSRILQQLDLVLVDLFVRPDHDLSAERIQHVVQRNPAEDAIPQALDDFPGLDKRRDFDPVYGSAVVLRDDHVLSHVDEAPRQIARVRRLERGIGQSLSSPVGRDEVFEHREPLSEVREDRSFDDFAGRLRHQTADPRKLADLLRRPTRSRVGHDEDRIETGDAHLLAAGCRQLLLG